MKYLTRRLLITGILFLLAPIWMFPFIDEITLWYVEQILKGKNYGILEFDMLRFPMEFGTFHILFWIGVWCASIALLLFGIIRIAEGRKAI